MQTSLKQPARSDPASGPVPVAIEVRDLTMAYGTNEVVKGIDFAVKAGEIFAFLGPNGAGKTTTVEILEGFRSRSGGEVEVLGLDPAHATSAWRDRVGVVLQSSVPEPDLNVRETIDLYAGFYRQPRSTDEILALTGLEAQAMTRNRRLSGGQQRRLDVALALVGDPDVLFLDEPTTGFDPAARRTAWETIAGLKELGKTVFLTTHYLDEAEYLADRIAVIDGGRIVAVGTPANLGGRDRQPSAVRFALVPDLDRGGLPGGLADIARGLDDDRIEFDSLDAAADLLMISEWAALRGARVERLEVIRPSLEATYLALTNGGKGS
ncbi:MAG TPA: ABC transporter ATP-binding protein, partial [Acidimicrobiales bacterium]|nr:ABC transporter ATP-binding protein [Acidimicrobiales bacterium]